MALNTDKHLAALQKARAAGDVEAMQVIRGRILEEQKRYQGEVAMQGRGTAENVLSGIGHGMASMGDLAKKWTGVGSPTVDEEASAPLMDTTAGQVGNFVGETAATAPLGMGVGGTVAKLGGLAKAAKLARTAKMLQGPVTNLVAQGAAEGAFRSPDDALTGGVLGGVTAGVLGKTLGGLSKMYKGVITPTAGARKLMAEGVPLTGKQIAPSSRTAIAEELASGSAIFGPAVKQAEQKGLEGWQDLVLKKGVAPGEIASTVGTAAEKLAENYKGFKVPYTAIKGTGKAPAGINDVSIRTAFEKIVDDPNALVDDAVRVKLGKWLDNQSTVLGNTKPGSFPKATTNDRLLKVRSNIREAAREATKNQRFDEAALLDRAEEQVTKSLKKSLPADAAKLLKKTDKAYRQYKVVEGALARAGDQPGGMTPAHLSQAVKAMESNSGAYARGAGGNIRELAQQGREAFTQQTPRTGWVMGSIAGLPIVGPMVGKPIIDVYGKLAATQGKRLAGMGPVQQRMQALEQALRGGGRADPYISHLAATMMNQEGE